MTSNEMEETPVDSEKEESEAPLMAEVEDVPVDGAEAERLKKKGWTETVWIRMQELGIVKTVAWIFMTMMYQVIGAVIYISVEGENDHVLRIWDYNNKTELLRNREVWIGQLVDSAMVVDQGAYPDDQKLSMYGDLINGYELAMGFNATAMIPVMKQEGWSWLNSMFFCCSLYTSIGFGGRLYPQTTSGQVVTMIYSFIGVPFMLTMTGDLGLIVFEGIYVCWWQIVKRVRAHQEEEFTEDQIRAFKTSEYNELYKKQLATFPVLLGAMMSVISQLLCAVIAQFFEKGWTFFDANYYFLTSFLTIGLGDIQPSAPENNEEFTLIIHIVLLIFCMTFLGLFQHVLSRRIELAYVTIGYAIHMEFRTRQVEPDISVMKCNQGPIAEERQMALIVRKLGQTESILYGMMDSSRRKLLHDTWHKKANMKCMEIQTNLPKREVGCQHLMNIDEELDTFGYGDDLGEEAPPVKPQEEPDLRPYVYKVMDD